ncbi:hypothetical protein [Rhizobium sp. L1K21]|nr:hypothetical protein [Rhizobium sp. L1K21]
MNISVNVTLSDLTEALRRLAEEARGAKAQDERQSEKKEKPR